MLCINQSPELNFSLFLGEVINTETLTCPKYRALLGCYIYLVLVSEMQLMKVHHLRKLKGVF